VATDQYEQGRESTWHAVFEAHELQAQVEEKEEELVRMEEKLAAPRALDRRGHVRSTLSMCVI